MMIKTERLLESQMVRLKRVNAIENLHIPWVQLSDLKGWDAEATKVYGVNSIPHLMLINPDGSIAAKGMNEKELRIKLQELLK